MIKTRLVGLLSHAKKYIVYNIFWQWIALLAQILAVFSIAGLLEKIIEETIKAEDVQRTIYVLAGVIAVRFLCDRFASRASYAASVDVKRILREKIYEKLLKMGASYREKITTSEVVQLSTEGVEQLETYFGKYLPQLFYSLMAPVTLFIVLMRVNMRASMVLLVCVPLIPLSIAAVQRFAKKLLNKYWGIYTNLGDSFLENLQGLTTLKIYQADGEKAKLMDEESQSFRRITMKVLTMQLNSTSVMDIIAYGGAAAGMITALLGFLRGDVGFAGTFSILLLASEFFIPLRLLGSFFHIAMNGMAASDKIFALLDLPEPEKGNEIITEDRVQVELSGVSFAYEENRNILKNINLSLQTGSFVSLVGTSGCGKSTIAGLITGKNRGYTGSIQINGIPIQNIKEESLMDHVTLVRHNSYLFKGTVEENLRMGKPDAAESEMNEALQKVNLLEFLRTQKGLATPVAEKGGNLSGGQCQRLALARALLHDTPVYIFDEATSNIDAESEELIMRVIHELAGIKTVLLISHRLSNVTASDCIYMLQEGSAAECGTHEELMKKRGAYYHMYNSQKSLETFGMTENGEAAV
jgi:ABC-type transport system involved in cytochrome bd biosynthesis fused ATPase/permease subunit